MKLWLIQHDVALELQRARDLGLERQLSEEQKKDFATFAAESAGPGVPRNYQVIADVAQISVEGVLTPKPDLYSYYFGGGNTTWESIRQALALAQSDAQVKRVQWNINSPGGAVDGMFDTLGAVQAFTKPMSVRAAMACSAAYTLAAICGKIEATNVAAYFGSVGIVRTYYLDEHIHEVTNREAPNKRPDPKTPEGKAAIQDELDAIADLVHEAIAKGRSTTVKDVVQNFGRGGTLLAGEAKRLGMIDKISKPTLRALPTEDVRAENEPASDAEAQPTNASAESGAAETPRGSTMKTKEELRLAHPDLYASVLAEGTEAGVKQERDRVTAHLIRGQASGAIALAVEAVEKGEPMTETYRAKYDTAGRNRSDTQAHQTETEAAAAVVNGATPPGPAAAGSTGTADGGGADLGDQVASKMRAARGKGQTAA